MPAMIFTVMSAHDEVMAKREEAIRVCLGEGLVNEQTVTNLLRSFISGDPLLVLEPLLRLCLQ
jgi:hypothetical protein